MKWTTLTTVRRALAFVVVTFAATWTLWLASAALHGGSFRGAGSFADPAGWIFLAGVFMPGVVAVTLTWVIDGRDAARRLFQQTLRVPPRTGWLVFALLFMVGVRLAAAAAHRAIWDSWPPFGDTPLLLMVAGTLMSTPFQAGEEIGWRGYLLPSLSSSLGRPAAAVLVGIVWGAWHLPVFLLPGADTSGQSFPVYLLSVTGISVALAWVYWRTGESLLVTMLMHAAVNNTKGIVPVAPSAVWDPFGVHAAAISWLSAVVLWALAIPLLWNMRLRRASPADPQRT